jgi:hypothetical protein
MTPRSRRPAMAHVLRPLAFWGAVTGGASALAAGVMLAAMQASGTLAALAPSALALLAMALIPAVLTPHFATRATVPVASALVLTMAAMSTAAASGRAGAIGMAAPLAALGGIALLAALYLHWRRDATARPAHTHAAAPQPATHALMPVPGNNMWLIAPALLAGLSSGVLARFQFFAVCGGGTASVAHVAASLAVVILAGSLAERVDHRRALLAFFVLRAALLAALTLDALTPWLSLAAPAFALLDYLTLPTLMRGGSAARAAQAGCPGLAHHAGMLAGAALATTSWGFGQGFYTLFLVGGALNVACACALAAQRLAGTRTYSPASPALAASSGIALHQSIR